MTTPNPFTAEHDVPEKEDLYFFVVVLPREVSIPKKKYPVHDKGSTLIYVYICVISSDKDNACIFSSLKNGSVVFERCRLTLTHLLLDFRE